LPGALVRPLDSVEHYRANAARMALSPNLAFDEFWYRYRYADVDALVKAGAIASGWEHYLELGCGQNRNPAWWFDEEWYKAKNPDGNEAVKSGQFACGFEHYLLYGIRQDLSPSLYFDATWYRRQYLTTVDAQEAYPIVDYLLAPDRDARCPVRFFDAGWYRATYLCEPQGSGTPEAPRWQSAYGHYLLVGQQQQWSPSPRFNERAYRELNSDAAEGIAAGRYLSGLEHYIREGASTGAFVATHLGVAGVDYAGPAFVRAYERSLRLNLRQLDMLQRLVAN
jgi:hypothetical protein